MRRSTPLLLGLLALLGGSTVAAAQDAAPPAGQTPETELEQEADVSAPQAAPPSDEAIDAAMAAEEAAIEDEDSGDSGLSSFLSERVALHGYGNWAFGWTQNGGPYENNYSFGDGNGNFSNVLFALRQIVTPIPELMFSMGENFYYDDVRGAGAELFFAFAEYRPNSWFSMRLGRMPFEVGLYTPVFDVGTLRPFAELPQAFYGPVGTVPKNYNGGSVSANVELDSGWSLRFTAFAGDATMPLDPALVESFNLIRNIILAPELKAESATDYNLLVGGVLNVWTPIPGMQLQVSGYVVPPNMDEVFGELNYVLTASFGYLGDNLETHAEYAYRHTDNFADIHAVYGEAAYRFFESWQVALRVDYLDFGLYAQTPTIGTVLAQLDDYSRHVSFGGGLNYWFTRDFVVKLSYQFILFNHFAHPVDQNAGSGMAPPWFDGSTLSFDVANKTHYLSFASSFSF